MTRLEKTPAERSERFRDAFITKLGSRIREFIPRKELPSAEVDRVTVFPMQIRDAGNIREGLYPTDDGEPEKLVTQIKGGNTKEEIDFLFNTLLPAGDTWFTHSIWIGKDPDSNNPFEVMLPSGKDNAKIVDDQRRIPSEAEKQERASRILQERLHLYGVIPSKIQIASTRVYVHDHLRTQASRKTRPGGPSRLNTSETIFSCEAPPCALLEPLPVDPRGTDTTAFLFTPGQLENFFKDGRVDDPNGQTWHILDSLGNDPILRQRFRVETDGQEDLIKSTLLQTLLAYELDIRLGVAEELLKITAHSPSPQAQSELRAKLDEITGKYQHLNPEDLTIEEITNDFQAFFFLYESKLTDLSERDSFKEILNNPIGRHLKRNAKDDDERRQINDMLIPRLRMRENIAEALTHTAFRKSAELTGNSGPQQPFLMVQLLLAMPKITQREYEVLKSQENCAPLTSLIDALARAFDINPANDSDWFNKIKNGIENFHQLRIAAYGHPGMTRYWTHYRFRKNKIKTALTHWLGLSSSESYQSLRTGITEFLAYLSEPLKKQVGKIIPPSDIETITSFDPPVSLEEMILPMFGFKIRSDMRDQNADSLSAWTFLLLARRLNTLKAERKKVYDHHEALFDHAFFQFTTPAGKRVVDFDEDKQVRLPMYKLPYLDYVKYNKVVPRILTAEFGRQKYQIDFPFEEVRILSILRESVVKTDHSVLRKDLERSSNPADTFGRYIVIDSERLRSYIQRTYSKLPSQVTDELVNSAIRYIAAGIITFYKSFLQGQRESVKYEIYRVREHKGMVGTLALAGFRPPGSNYQGSAALRLETDWLKFDHAISFDETNVEEELQIFGSVEAYRKKINDDARYALERLFISHKEGRFPLMLVLFRNDVLYEELIYGYKSLGKDDSSAAADSVHIKARR